MLVYLLGEKWCYIRIKDRDNKRRPYTLVVNYILFDLYSFALTSNIMYQIHHKIMIIHEITLTICLNSNELPNFYVIQSIYFYMKTYIIFDTVFSIKFLYLLCYGNIYKSPIFDFCHSHIHLSITYLLVQQETTCICTCFFRYL